MRPSYLPLLAGLALLSGCGGSRETPTTPLPPQKASDAAMAFLLVEQSQGQPAALPRWEPQGEALALVQPATAPGCVATSSVANGDGTTTLTFTFACTNPDGSSLAGSVAYTFGPTMPGAYTVEYQGLKAVKGERSWTVNGSKRISVDLAGKRAAVATLVPLTLTITGDASPKTYTYTCNLTGDWNTAGLYKVSGGFTLQSGSEAPLTCTLTTPLTWDGASGCCHPVSGVMALVQGNASATVSFGLPCGTYQVSGLQTFAPMTLPACPN